MAASRVLPILVLPLILLPMIGSRSLGGGGSEGLSVVNFDTSEEAGLSANVPGGGNNFTIVAPSSPCALVTMSLLDGRDGKLVAYDDKTLITVSHDIFDVSQGIVPNIVYQAVLEIPSSHEFSLEFWLNGLSEDKAKQKRRHQRDRRDTLLELYPPASDSSLYPNLTPFSDSGDASSEPFVFCSKSSIAGVNREAKAKQLRFHWFINGNNFIPQAAVSGLPSNVIFRLRFRSIVEATTSVFEQNLSAVVRSDCYLQLKVEDTQKLTLDSLWNGKTDNAGLNCTVFIVPKKNFGLELRLSSLSVYGMRDICKGRFLQFTRPKRISSAFTSSSGSSAVFSSGNSSESGSGPSKEKHISSSKNFVENLQELSPNDFLPEDGQLNSPLERKLCGKLEDYSESERTLTFPSSESTLLSSREKESEHFHHDNHPKSWGIYLTVKLPVAVKAREAFAFDLRALSPCQGIKLNELDGELKYSRHYDNDQCSVVIHVPYGNTILAQIAVSSGSSGPGESRLSTTNNEVLSGDEEGDEEPLAPAEVPSDFITDSYSSRESRSGNPLDLSSPTVLSSSSPNDDGNGSTINTPVNSSSDLPSAQTPTEGRRGGRKREVDSRGESDIDNSIQSPPPPMSSSSYECPSFATEVESNSIGVLGGESAGESGLEENDNVSEGKEGLQRNKYLLIQAVDLVSGSEFNWCFDAAKQNSAHKRAWKSSGNRVSINFRLSHFDTFVLTYQSVKIPELAGDCERGWVKVEGSGCVGMVEKPIKWTDAEEQCQLRGGHLVTVRNEGNEHKLEKLITESPLFHPTRAYWIGANDRESEGNFQWTSGLPFLYKNWFPGWAHKSGRNDRSEILSAQPNDDGWSGQDCVEIRQNAVPFPVPSTSDTSSNAAFTPILLKSEVRGVRERGHAPTSGQQGKLSPPSSGSSSSSKFYWNDRNCEVKNFYLCERGTHQNVDVSCNRTLKLSPPQVSSLVVTSPTYPNAYPDNIVCVTSIETVPGFKLVLSFDEFILEESPGCQYDSLEIREIQNETLSESPASLTSTLANGKQKEQSGVPRANGRQDAKNGEGTKICGDWTKRLKLLRYTTASKTTQVVLKFESDYSHHFPGFKLKVTAEKDTEEQCMEQQMLRYGSHCYLLVSFPAVTWNTANQICQTLKGNLVSIVSAGEWGFLTRTLLSAPDYDKKSIYWLGGSIDQHNQLVWADHMPFNFSGFHPADLQTRYDFRCLSVYWHDVGGGKGDLAWRLTECSQTAGYICKKRTQVESRQIMNRTFSGTGGKLASPNYPSNYVNNMDHRHHLVAPRTTKVVIRFSHFDVEPQENCLYDYVEILDRVAKNRTRFCGSYLKDELNRLDYVSSSNEVDVIFHTDFSNTFTGYELVWRAVDVTSCVAGKTIMAGFVGSPFPLGDQTIHTPNFPFFNLPHLDCVYHIVAPAGQRLWINFQVFELGTSSPTSDSDLGESSTPWTGIDCQEQDHVSIDLSDGQQSDKLPHLANDNEILLCGNLSSVPFRASFLSSSERLVIRVRSPQGRTGSGFLGRFKAVPQSLKEALTVNLEANSTVSFTSLNYPLEPPPNANLSVSFIAPPQYVITLKVQGTTRCSPEPQAYLEIRDQFVGKSGLTKLLCNVRDRTFPSYVIDESGRGGRGGNSHHIMKNDDVYDATDNDDRMEGDNGISLGTTVQFRSRFNRLEVKQVYAPGFRGSRWRAQIITSLDENFRAEVIADGDRLLLLNACSPNPCSNGGTCVTDKGKHICRCPTPYTGPFCSLSLCDLNPCLFGECVMEGKSFKCKCQLGYGGERCERRYKPCDDRPCSGHGDCIEVNKTSYKCLCHAWWEGPQCDSRMIHIPYKPLSQRMLEEPFWLGLITVFVVMGVIGLIWCLKRHFPEKLEKFLSEDLERNRGISWAPSSVRTGGVVGPGPGMRDAIPGTSQQAASPPTTRSFLGRLGIRKPSLLSLSSATSNVSATVASPHTYENRTFSLDDLLRPSRGMLRTPSPHRRRNYSVQVRRDPAEKQQILQQLVSPGPSMSFDGESKPVTPKPTLAEIIQMSERRLRLASQSSMQEPQPSTSAAANNNNSQNTSIDSVMSQRQDSAETSFTTLAPPLTQAQKAEKKVTFAHMLDKLAAGEMTSSSSCSDVSCGEDSKIVVTVPLKPVGKKDRKGRFRRSKPYRSRTSEEDGAEISSSDTTPDPMFPPRFPLRICISPTNVGPSSSSTVTLPPVPTSLSAKPQSSSSGKLTKIASADSLLSLFRRFSGSSSAPPSPQYSENEESSAGATPLSTPSSPRNSALSLRPPAFLITTPADSTGNLSNNNNNNSNNTIELPVIDPFSLGPAPGGQGWGRAAGAPNITLEVPMRDYCLSPIHEVPTPLPTPSHSPAHTPMMRRSPEGIPMIKVQSSEEGEEPGHSFRRDSLSVENNNFPPRKLSIPLISISIDEGEILTVDNEADDNDDKRTPDLMSTKHEGASLKRKTFSETQQQKEPEVLPDVLINVPPDAPLESKPESGSFTACSTSGEPPLSPTSQSATAAGYQAIGHKPRPPPLVFANEILTSCSSKNSKEGSESSSSSSSSSKNSSCCSSSSCTSTSSSTSGSTSSCSSACAEEAPTGGGDTEKGMLPCVVPMLSVEFPTPLTEALPKLSPEEPQTTTLSDKTPVVEVVSCMAIPEIWDCPLAPPMITINQSSEAESDSDTTPLTKSSRMPNLNFLSPFAGESNRVPSESNLSTSGYSSMASPCASRCPSVSPLCSGEMEEYHHHNLQQLHFLRRSSLTPGTPKRTSPTPRRSSLNSGSLTSGGGGLFEKRSQSEERYEEDKKKLAEVDVETDSAVEVETDLEAQTTEINVDGSLQSPPESEVVAPHPPQGSNPIFPEELRCINNLLQVPKKGFPKSRSLDINSTMINDPNGGTPQGGGGGVNPRNHQLKALVGPSLDSKLNSILEPFLKGGITISLPLASTPKSQRGSTGNLMGIPEDSKTERRLSPVSSRSESPLSELSAAGGFATFPVTDSDGMYDCASSEVPSNHGGGPGGNVSRFSSLNKLSPQQQLRRSGRRKDRRLRNKLASSGATLAVTSDLLPPPLTPSPVVYQSVANSPASSCDNTRSPPAAPSGIMLSPGRSQLVFPHIDLPPSLARESLVPAAISKRASPKRRVRAQPALDASSSSSESLSSRSRSRTSVSSFHQSSSSPKRSVEDAEPAYALSDSAIGTRHSISDEVSNKGAATALESNEPSIVSTKKNEGASVTKPDVIQQQPTSSSTSAAIGLQVPKPQSGSSSGGRKISRLRTISHQIRFLRRLELSLIRKKECLTSVNRPAEVLLASTRHEQVTCLTRSDSWDTSREEDDDRTDNSEASSGESSAGGESQNDTEKPLIPRSSSSPGTLCFKGPSNRVKPKNKPGSSSKMTHMDLLDNCSAAELLSSHKKRLRKYK